MKIQKLFISVSFLFFTSQSCFGVFDYERIIDKGGFIPGKSPETSRQEAWERLSIELAHTQTPEKKAGYTLGKAKLFIQHGFIPNKRDDFPEELLENRVLDDLSAQLSDIIDNDIGQTKQISHAKIWLAMMIYKKAKYLVNNKDDSYDYAWKLLTEATKAHATKAADIRKAEMIVNFHYLPRDPFGDRVTRLSAIQTAEDLLKDDFLTATPHKNPLEKLREAIKVEMGSGEEPRDTQATEVGKLGLSHTVNHQVIKKLKEQLADKISREKRAIGDDSSEEEDFPLARKRKKKGHVIKSDSEEEQNTPKKQKTSERKKSVNREETQSNSESSTSKKTRSISSISKEEKSKIIEEYNREANTGRSDGEIRKNLLQKYNLDLRRLSDLLISGGIRAKKYAPHDSSELNEEEVLSLYNNGKGKSRKEIAHIMKAKGKRIQEILIKHGIRVYNPPQYLSDQQKEEIKKLYLRHGDDWSLAKIAREAGVKDKSHNQVSNFLEKEGLRKKAEVQKKSPLSKDQKAHISSLLADSSLTYENIATITNASVNQITKVAKGEGIIRYNRPNTRITAKQIACVLKLHKTGKYTYEQIGNELGLTRMQVQRVLTPPGKK